MTDASGNGDAGSDGEGRYSVAFPRRAWYPVGRAGDIGRKPHPFTLMEQPLVAFRDGAGAPRVLVDRCPHRNYPLSLGRVTPRGTLQCGYHGWQFDGCGTCVEVPGLLSDDVSAPTRGAGWHAATERDGFVWVWGEAGAEATGEPFPLPQFEGRGSSEVVFDYDLECTLHAALENALDVPHTAFLHAGIFRGGTKQRLTAVRRELPGGVEAQYLGEPIGFGPIRPRDTEKTFDHWDRFFLPSVAQVEYRVEGWFRIVNTILHLPLAPFRTRAWFVVRYRSRVPGAVVKPVVLARGKQILRQDARALAAQTERVRQAGGERYASTELDILGNAIWRLLRRAERAEAEGADGQVVGGNGARQDADREQQVVFEV